MHCTRNITEDLIWVGANDRRLLMFEGVYSVKKGVAYNSYILLDKKTVLFDTVDKAVSQSFLENVREVLTDITLDYIVVQHLEPDHSYALMDVLNLYKEAKIVCNEKTLGFIKQFFDFHDDKRVHLVKENDVLNTGKHQLQFIMAPMVHWPEVMITYDLKNKILFSADAFGCFGALNGALFADEVDFNKDYLDEARRYYTNIVGKYGDQVQSLLNKAANLEIEIICPLHGFVWRRNLQDIINKYEIWSKYLPEEKGVVIAYASVYGNTENAAEIVSTKLRDYGINTAMYDVSVTAASEILAATFRYSHLVLASTTYNAHIFVTMEAFLNDLVAHNFQNRTIGIIENGSWAPSSGLLIKEQLEKCQNIRFINDPLTIKSSVKEQQFSELETLALKIKEDIIPPTIKEIIKEKERENTIDTAALFNLSYGLFVLSARKNEKDNACIVNTVMQVTDTPLRVSVTVNKNNLTHDMILATRKFNISVLSETVPFKVFERFGFKSGRDIDKFSEYNDSSRSNNGLLYLTENANTVISGEVIETFDFPTHTMFIAEVIHSVVLSTQPSVTYQYYFDHIKPQPQQAKENKKGFICKICGYVYEGEVLPEDFICPLCKHGSKDFEII